MSDPRLIEIEILSALDKEDPSTSSPYHPKAIRGHTERLWEDALLHLMFEACVIHGDYTGPPSTYTNDPNPDPRDAVNRAAKMSVDVFQRRHTMQLRITHAGRLRLYRLRDEILSRDRVRDDFGILWSRRHWDPDLEVRLRMHDFPQPFSVIRLDVDRLGRLNTAFLHTGADEILRGAFSLLQNAVAPHQAYRLGGDEAGAILPGVTLKDARHMAEETRAAVERTFGIEKWRLDDGSTPTVSLGVVTVTAYKPPAALDEDADAMTYRAKQRRNAVEPSSEGER